MKRFVFGSLAVMVAVSALAQAPSIIPPHVTVVTECQKVHAVYLVDDRKITKYDITNTPSFQLSEMASMSPHNEWIEAGCSK